MRSLKIIFAIFFTFHISSYVFSQSLKEYKVLTTSVPIIVDGIINEQSWEKAPITENFITIKGNSAATSTKAKMLWDSSYLYIAFMIEDYSVWSTLKGRDVELWNQDVVEIFIDPNNDGLNYIELGFSPNGNMYDYLIGSAPPRPGNIDTGWNLKGILSKVQVNGALNSKTGTTGWVCEVAIPFADASNNLTQLTKPNPNDSWRINLCRVDFDYRTSEGARFYTWNYTNGGSFHVPSRFGKIIFVNGNE